MRNDNRTIISVQVPPVLKTRIEQACAAHSMRKSDWLRTVLAAAVNGRIVLVADQVPFSDEQPLAVRGEFDLVAKGLNHDHTRP